MTSNFQFMPWNSFVA
jgi:hypothetical protein